MPKNNNVGSVEEALGRIEVSIQRLKDCSNKDFSIFASCFDRAVKSVSTLVCCAKTIFSIVEPAKSGQMISEIKDLYFKNETILKAIRSFQFRISDFKSGTDYMQSLFLVYIENCAQDIKTHDFLISSLSKYSGSAKETPELAEVQALSARVLEGLAGLKRVHGEFRLVFEQFLDFFSDESFQTIGFIDEPFVETERDFNKKKKIVEEVHSVFSMRQTSHDTCLSDIVTNLQYNDIIGQKIEHVSQIISDVSLRLKHVKLNGAESSPSELPTIRKAAELQSAQLVQINLDYQEAVKAIFRRLEELSENASDISMLTHSFYSKHGKKGSYLFDLSQHLALPLRYFDIVARAHDKIGLVIEQGADLVQAQAKINENLKHSAALLAAMPALIDEDSSIGNAIKTVRVKVAENLRYISTAIENFSKTSKAVFSSYRLQDNEIALQEVEDQYLLTTQRIKDSDAELTSQIGIASSIAQNLNSEINGLLNDMAFYSMFESELNVISSELSHIESVLEGDSSEQAIDERFFQVLRSRYTMKSEHDVHDTVLLVSGTGYSEYDDVEFF
jgi:hypothetical protein